MQSSSHALVGLALATTISFANAVPANAQTSGAPAFALATANAEITRDPQTGLVRWMIGNGQPLGRAGLQASTLSYADAAAAFLQSQAASFGLTGASNTAVSATRVKSDDIGHAFVRFQQRYKGIPILAAELNVQLDEGRNVLSVNGRSVGDLDLSTDPSVSSANALKIALAATGGAHAVSQANLVGSIPRLAIHDARTMGGPPASPKLVWQVVVTSRTDVAINEFVLVDAQNGRVVVEFNQTENVAPANATQRVCDANNTTSKVPCTAALDIPNPAASAIPDVKNAFKFAENTFDFYARRFNRNSLNATGLVLISTTRYCDPSQPCPFANAFWNGAQMVYGDTYASADDVVGHELSHGFTDFESHLFYYYQSGAVNESLSDIFGELIDQSNATNGPGGAVKWKMGEDLPIGAIRDMSNPPLFNDPDKITSSLWTGDFGFTDRGGVHTNSGVGNKTAYLITEPGSHTFNGKTVVGIGVDKSAAIWYYVNNLLLQSGSDYADVGTSLRLACHNLTGTRPKTQAGAPSPAGVITAANCAQVGNAVLATELAKAPPIWPIAAEAPFCSAGKVPTFKINEKFEGAQAGWKFKPSDATHWFVTSAYAASNKFAVGAGDPNSGPLKYNTFLTQAAALAIPPGAFLRFADFFNLRNNAAGGVLERSINGGAFAIVPTALFLNNPYNATISSDSSLNGQRAFSAFSGGWTSSRVNLASFAGKSVKFRFRLSTSSAGAFDSWILDDIQIYTCAAPTASVNVAMSTAPAGDIPWTSAAAE